MDRLRVIKVKRKHGDEPSPDLLVLDHLVDPKRQKAVTRLYERLNEPSAKMSFRAPIAQIRPSPSEALLSLKVSDDLIHLDVNVDNVKIIEENERDQFDVYMLRDDDDFVKTVDLTEIARLFVPEHELILLDNSASEDDHSHSSDDSNAEDYYQNDYPDEVEGEDDELYGYEEDPDDEYEGYIRKFKSLEEDFYDEEYEYVNGGSTYRPVNDSEEDC